MDLRDARGVALGLACGDALGRPVEFRSREAIRTEHGTLTAMVGHGTWGQPAGTITDDTEQALCLARSVAELGAWDPSDVADRFVDSLQTALHDALLADDAEEAVVTAVNRGDDTDTVGAITGGVAGARFGVDERSELVDLADRLASMGN